MSETIRAFVADFIANDRAKRAMGYSDTSQRLQRVQVEAQIDTSLLAVKAQHTPPAPDLMQNIGVKVSSYKDGLINRPRAIRRVGAEIWIGSSSTRISRFDSNWSFLGYWGKYGNPNTVPDAYASLNDFVVDEANDKIVIVCNGYHRIRCFQLSTAQPLWDFGTGAPGDYAAGQLYSPYSIELLPNGNVAVASYSGRGEIGGATGGNSGFIAEIDMATGAPVACRLMNQNGGEPWAGGISTPTKIRLLNGQIYIACYNIHAIGVFDPTTWEETTSYTKPAGFDIQAVYPRGICLNDALDQVVVAANGPKVLVAIGTSDHDYKWHSGEQQFDDRSAANDIPGELQDIWDVLNLGGGYYAVADSGNNRISVLPEFNYAAIAYTVPIPTGYELVEDGVPEGFDPETMTRMVKLNKLSSIGDVYLPVRKVAQ